MTQTNFLEISFNADKEEGTPPRQLLPRDLYKMEICQATAGKTKNGAGYAVNLGWRVIEGPYEGQQVYQSCLLQHDNEDVERWGRQRFKDVLSAMNITGDLTNTDLGVLYNKPCKVAVKIKQDKTGQYPDKNEVSRVMSMTETRPYAPLWKKDDPISTGNGKANDLNDSLPDWNK
jgi:hypothetical protein